MVFVVGAAPGMMTIEVMRKLHLGEFFSLSTLFNDLDSQDSRLVDKAGRKLNELCKRWDLHHLILQSLPIWSPIVDEVDEIKDIVLRQSDSTHPAARQRAFVACEHLIAKGHSEGEKFASELASKKLRNSDEAIQIEGLHYFTLLLKKSKPNLKSEDLSMAISIASKLLATSKKDCTEGYRFFEKLIEQGKEEDILRIEQKFLDVCRSDRYYFVFNLCTEKIINCQKKDLLSIPLAVASFGCRAHGGEILLSEKEKEELLKKSSEDVFLSDKTMPLREEGFKLFLKLLSWAPTESIDVLIENIFIESKIQSPCIGIISRLRELIGHNPSNLSREARKVILSRKEKDKPLLLEVLDNLSKCLSPYHRKVAAELKQNLLSIDPKK